MGLQLLELQLARRHGCLFQPRLYRQCRMAWWRLRTECNRGWSVWRGTGRPGIQPEHWDLRTWCVGIDALRKRGRRPSLQPEHRDLRTWRIGIDTLRNTGR